MTRIIPVYGIHGSGSGIPLGHGPFPDERNYEIDLVTDGELIRLVMQREKALHIAHDLLDSLEDADRG